MSEFEIKCHGVFRAKRFRVVKPAINDVIKEEYKICDCPICGLVIVRQREYKKLPDKPLKKSHSRLRDKKALDYLVETLYNRTELIDYSEPKGSKSASQWFHGYKGIQYDHNGKSHGSVVSIPQKELVLAG